MSHPIKSPTGERRRKIGINLAPSAEAKAKADAAARGLSFQAHVEALLLDWPPLDY